jgi:membrane-associated phospholipid phosphatase
MFGWPLVGRLARVGLVAYTLAMAVTLVYAGEHYVADVLLGWVYAAIAVGAMNWWFGPADRPGTTRAPTREGEGSRTTPDD